MDIPSGPIQMVILEHSELPPPNAIDANTIAQLDATIKSVNWMEIHYCVTEIRKIIKFNPNFAMDIVQRYSNAFVDLFNNGKTQIIKNLLHLVKELFDLGQQVNVEKAVYTFLPIIIKKSSTDIGHIKVMSQHVLTSFVVNCGYDISFKVAAGFCMDNNTSMAQLSIKLLAKLVQHVGDKIMQLNPDTLKDMMFSLKFLIKGKRQNMRVQGLDICMYVYNLLGSQNYLNLMNYSLSPDEVENMASAMQNHRTSKRKTDLPLSIIKQQRKSQIIMMGPQSNNDIMLVNQNNMMASNMIETPSWPQKNNMNYPSTQYGYTNQMH